MQGDTLLVWRNALHYAGRHFISMQEDTISMQEDMQGRQGRH